MSDWQRLRLKDMVYGIRGVSYSPADLHETYSNNSVVLLRSNNISSGVINFRNVKFVADTNVSDSQILREGDIAVCMSNGSKALVGKSARFVEDGARVTVGAFCSIFRPKEGHDHRFIAHVFQSQQYREHIDFVLAGSAINNLQNKTVESLALLAPFFREQRAIAQILDTLDTQIQKTEALTAKLETIREGLLHDLLTRGIDQNGQLRPTPEKAPDLYKKSALGLIPKEWEVRKLGTMSEIVSGVTLGGQQPSSSWPLVAYLRVANVQDGYLDLEQVKFLRVKPADVDKFRLIPGDVLMNEGGDFDKLGRGTVWEGEIESCIHQNHVFRVRTFSELLDPYFLAYFSGSARGKAYFVKSSKQSTNLASINSTQLKAFEVPVPPFAEQSAIVDYLRSYKKRLELENRNMRKLKAQKTGLMDDLLTGRVHVMPLLKDADVV